MNPVPSHARPDLARLAANHRWSWHEPTRVLLASLPGASATVHPSATVAALTDDDLGAWLAAGGHEAALAEACAELDAVVAAGGARFAYFSPEFGVSELVPQYSGGLGILAGDHCKAASDLATPLVGVGLLYRQGFFRQDIVDEHQVERYETVDPEGIGAVDTGRTVTVPIEGTEVVARVWEQWVGATRLVLLDTDVAANTPAHRTITDRLYSGDRRHRLHQELVLGVGGVRALRALDLQPEVFHLNEGHACFLLLELLAEQVDAGADLAAAIETVRRCTLFTTHTPVEAGIDRFDADLVGPELAGWATRLGTTVATIEGWATLPADGTPAPFNTAALCLSLCGEANGVSALHGEVSRTLFSSVPAGATIGSVTNGVHSRTWVTPALQQCFDRELGPSWADGDPEAWALVDRLDDVALGSIRRAAKEALAELVAERAGVRLDPEACTVGFARRFATYKRTALLLREPERVAALLADDERPVQFVFAGKAHPADAEGKAVLTEVAAFAASPAANGRLVLVPDYDAAVARAMYAASDVWLNNPRRPYEACGTSGEKAALNGGLNLSILDGWWAEWYRADAGWALPTSTLGDADARDDAEARALHDLLEGEVLPRYYRDGAPGADWWALVRTAWRHLGPRVTAARMMREYTARYEAIAAR